MNKQQIIALQSRIGAIPDGFWGPQSIAACQKHLRALMPKPNPWPEQSQSALTAFYGPTGDSRLTRISVRGMGVRYDGQPVSGISVHQKCADSLARVLTAISKSPFAGILGEFGGVYAHRPMRGGSLPSLHARGAAIDLAPGTNGLHTHWPTRATMPLEVMEMFAEEGWLAAGAFWGRDAMHFQATR
jgi:hypothetical protein